MSYEHERAIFEAEQSAAADAYFSPRPVFDSAHGRITFDAGFERAWNLKLQEKETELAACKDKLVMLEEGLELGADDYWRTLPENQKYFTATAETVAKHKAEIEAEELCVVADALMKTPVPDTAPTLTILEVATMLRRMAAEKRGE